MQHVITDHRFHSQHTLPTNPTVWGPCLWKFLHVASFNYPVEPSAICKEHTKRFIKSLPMLIPCEVCALHAKAYVVKHDNCLDRIVSTRNELAAFYVNFHNEVNKRYNKPFFTFADAEAMYSA
jgi:mitochondrial FAD-linked sulfhydryl oxidase